MGWHGKQPGSWQLGSKTRRWDVFYLFIIRQRAWENMRVYLMVPVSLISRITVLTDNGHCRTRTANGWEEASRCEVHMRPGKDTFMDFSCVQLLIPKRSNFGANRPADNIVSPRHCRRNTNVLSRLSEPSMVKSVRHLLLTNK